MTDPNPLLRALPPVDRVLKEKPLPAMLADYPRALVVEAVQEVVESCRLRIMGSGGGLSGQDLAPPILAQQAARLVEEWSKPKLRPVINATGIILHTNLGRSPLPSAAIEAITEVASGYCNLEYSLARGERGSRQEHLEELLRRLCGAEAALVVNNNAAAVLLALQALAADQEVIVSRGQLVEIGGSFRLPEVLKSGGAALVEVGTTNRVYIDDYEAAIGERTAMLLKVHPSNYRIVGFTAEVGAVELAALAHARGLLFMEDLGSGAFLDLSRYNLEAEPTVPESVAAGADLVSFSGDKLLGGPQSGLIVGRRHLIERLRRHQLARALRVDKLTLAALESTLKIYQDEERVCREIPVWRMIAATPAEIKQRADKLARQLGDLLGSQVVAVVPGSSKLGGGALPLQELPTFLVAITIPAMGSSALERRLRLGELPVIARVQQERLLLDLRTVFPEEEGLLPDLIRAAAGREGTAG